MAQRPIAVFDSGIGGLSVLRALRAALPHENFVYFADSANAPWGERSDDWVTQRSLAIAHELVNMGGAKALVVACNTATAIAVAALRQAYPALPVVAIEPALKPAAKLSRTGHVGVFATRATLNSARFQKLLQTQGSAVQFHCVPCDGLAESVERLAQHWDASKCIALCEDYIRICGPFGTHKGAMDMLVLGCTHYPLVDHLLQNLVGPDVALVEPGEAVARHTVHLLERAGLLNPSDAAGHLVLQSSADLADLERAVACWLPHR